MTKLALQADVCYNNNRNIVVLGSAANTPSRIHLIGDVPMDTIPQDNTPRKQCTNPDCQQWFPATPEFFYRHKHGMYGLEGRCKACRSKQASIYNRRPEVRERNTAQHRVYTHIPEVRDRINSLDKARNSTPKRQSWAKAYSQRRKETGYWIRPEVREHKRAYGKVYRNRPGVRERMLARSKVYGNSPKGQERRRIYHKDRYRLPDVQDRMRINHLNRVARKKAISGTYTTEQIQDLLKRQRYRCYYCSKHFGKKDGKYIYHIDHTFPLSRVVGTDIPANDISYLTLACPHCNLSKHDRFPWEFPEGGRLL